MKFSAIFSIIVTCDVALGINLYATHYDGTLSTLSYDSGSLSIVKKEKNCGVQPSWTTFDPTTKTLYCVDESYSTGTLSSLTVGSNGLTSTAKVNTIGNPVHTTLYGGTSGNGFLAIAHYNQAAFSTFKLPITSSSRALQSFTYTMSKAGPNPSRQEKPHPHAAVLDPTGSFMIIPDLGADIVRIYSIDKNSGLLTSCNNYTAAAGSGPRHASFYVPGNTSGQGLTGRRTRSAAAPTGTVMYLGNELGNTITSFSVTYPSNTGGCLALTSTKTIAPYPAGKSAPYGAKVAEVQVKGLTVTTSNRADNSFGNNNDSLALFSLSPSGEFTFQDIYPTYASYPRTMVINKAGDMVAIGNQNSASVTIVQRNTTSGVFGKLLASVVVGSQGYNGNGGLSSVIWEE